MRFALFGLGILVPFALAAYPAADSTQIQGAQPVGEVLTTKPVAIGGVNADGGVVTLQVNASGALNVNATVTPAAGGLQAVQGVDGGYPVATTPAAGSVQTVVGGDVDGKLVVTGNLNYASQTRSAESMITAGVSGGAPSDIPSGAPVVGRRSIMVQNQGSVAVRVGLAPSATSGYRLLAGDSVVFDCNPTACSLMGISESATVTSILYSLELE